MRKIVITLAVLILSAIPVLAETIVITDTAGRRHEFDKPAERIIALSGSLGLVCYMKQCSKVVAVEDLEVRKSEWVGSVGRSYALANPELSELPSTGSRNQPDAERIMKVMPDVIFSGSANSRFLDNLQNKIGVPVVAVDNGDLGLKRDVFYKTLKIIGEITGSSKRAQEIITYTDNAVMDLSERTSNIPPVEKPSVYIGGLNFRTAHGITGTSKNYPPFILINADNTADAFTTSAKLIKGRFTVDLEALLKVDPDIIFICESGIELVKNDLKNPALQKLKAITSKNVYGIVPHYYAASPDTVLAETYYMGKTIYPERFKDIEIKKKADEFYSFYTGKPMYKTMEKIFGGFKRIE